MAKILKLDDFLDDDIEVELKGKTYKIDTSIKSFMRFLKWEEEVKNLKNIELVGKDLDLLKFIIKDKTEEFIEQFENLSGNNQSKVLIQLIEIWKRNTLPQHILEGDDSLNQKKK